VTARRRAASRASALAVRLAVTVLAVVTLAGAAGVACHKSAASASPDTRAAPVVVRAESEGLLLTWIDDKGDFHVESRVADVPMMGRDAVRVVDPRDPATQQMLGDDDTVSVVDLRAAGADGTFPVRAMARSAFEALAVARREKGGPTLAAMPAPAPEANAAASAAHSPAGSTPRGGVVVIYGAEWCSACHDAAKYLRSKGIAYVDKDIEKDPGAAQEMQQKLARNGLNGGSIPVIDVRGKVMVGFNPAEIDAALGQAL
jgi:glutaredoxin